MSAQGGISTGQNAPVGLPKSDQKDSSDRLCKMNNQFLGLTFSLNST